MNSLLHFVYNSDIKIGEYVPLKLPAFIKESILREGEGIYSREEWSKARKRGYRNAGTNSEELKDDIKYINRIFRTQYRNLCSAQRISHVVNFNKFQKILEFGCGEMVQAFVIKSLYPNLEYIATDFDPYIIKKCKRINILDGINKKVLDISKITVDDLKEIDLCLAWEVAYALNEEELNKLFSVLSEAQVPMIFCTSQLAGPLRAIVRWFKGIPLSNKLSRFEYKQEEGYRMHGWNYSIGYLKSIAEKHKMRFSNLSLPDMMDVKKSNDNFTYLIFKAK